MARAIVRRSEGGKDYAASGLADLRNHGSLPEDGFRLLIEDVKNGAKVEREVTLSEVADLAILRAATGAWDQGQVGRFHRVLVVRDLSGSLVQLPNP